VLVIRAGLTHAAGMSHAKMNADGTMDVGGDAYRVVDVGADRFRLDRVRDGVAVGEILLPIGKDAETKATEPGAEAVLDAAATLLAGPRGILPLQ
jgi:hypothetical protein